MRLKISLFLTILALSSPLLRATQDNTVLRVQIDGPITQTMADYVIDGLRKASQENASAFLIELNCESGLWEPTRRIISAMTNADRPVIVYVSPSSARAKSMGLLILLASDVAAMAPQTELGAFGNIASVQGKMRSDHESMWVEAASTARALAEKKGRNMTLSEKIIKEGLSFNENDAFIQNMIENIEPSAETLIQMNDGKTISKRNQSLRLQLTNTRIQTMYFSDIRNLMHTANLPIAALILLTIGACGILDILTTRGGITLTGLLWLICFGAGAYSLYFLPVNFVGVGFLAAGLALMITELSVPFLGIFMAGGLFVYAAGLGMAIDPITLLNISSFPVSIIVPMMFAAGAFMFLIILPRAYTSTGKKKSKAERLIGEIGQVRERLAPKGKILVKEELWDARSNDPVEVGDDVYIDRVENNVLIVRRIYVP